MTDLSIEEFGRRMSEARREERAAVARFVAAVASADLEEIADSIGPLEALSQWRAALRAITRLPPPPPEVRRAFRRVWMSCGDALRTEAGDDLVLIKGLRVLLPRYLLIPGVGRGSSGGIDEALDVTTGFLIQARDGAAPRPVFALA